MRPSTLLLAAVLTILGPSLGAFALPADALQVYTTTDPDIASTKPTSVLANPWGAPAAGAPVTIAPGQTIWFGFLNTPDPDKRKYFRFEMSAPAGGLLGLTFGSAAGFSDAGDDSPVSKKFVSSYLDGNLAVREYRFTPQPEWERISYTNPAGGAAVIVNVSAGSACANSRPDLLTSSLIVDAGSIGSATPGAMYGTPRFNALWIFPATVPVNPAALQPFSAPVASGSWTSSVVYQTPLGGQRPLGGVLWHTLGLGLLPDQDFSLALALLNSLVDRHYEFYAFNATSQQMLQLSLDLSDLEPLTYCVGKTNSLGCTPAITSQGMPSASASNGFSVSCAQVRNNKPGVLLYGLQGRGSNAFQGGTLCLQPPIRRTLGTNSGGTGAPANDCSGLLSIDMNAFAAGALGGSPAPELSQPGRSVYCQWWSRDPQDQYGSSLSNALEYVVGN